MPLTSKEFSEVALLIWIKFWTIMDHGAVEKASIEITTTSDNLVSRNPSSQGAWLAALIASVAFLIPGGIAFVYFGFSFYRYILNNEFRLSRNKIHYVVATTCDKN